MAAYSRTLGWLGMVLCLALIATVLALLATSERPGESGRERTSKAPATQPVEELPGSGVPPRTSEASITGTPAPASGPRWSLPRSTPRPGNAMATPGAIVATTPAVVAPLEPDPTATKQNVAQDLDNLQFVLRDFRTAMNGNPIGTNAEIVEQLLGDNLKQVKLELPDGMRVNGANELCDRWGTPLFFHQLAKDKMEVRSAGPDRAMWTRDDLLR